MTTFTKSGAEYFPLAFPANSRSGIQQLNSVAGFDEFAGAEIL